MKKNSDIRKKISRYTSGMDRRAPYGNRFDYKVQFMITMVACIVFNYCENLVFKYHGSETDVFYSIPAPGRTLFVSVI